MRENDATPKSEQAIARTLTALAFDSAGLVPAIAQQHDSGEVLMISRSRNALWRKGESSEQTQRLVDFRIDCDGDTILLLVDQQGVACHTGRRNCFFNAVRDDDLEIIAEVEIDPKDLYGK